MFLIPVYDATNKSASTSRCFFFPEIERADQESAMYLSNSMKTQATEKEMIQLKMSNTQNSLQNLRKSTSRCFSHLQSQCQLQPLHHAPLGILWSDCTKLLSTRSTPVIAHVHVHLIPLLQLERNSKQSSWNYLEGTQALILLLCRFPVSFQSFL